MPRRPSRLGWEFGRSAHGSRKARPHIRGSLGRIARGFRRLTARSRHMAVVMSPDAQPRDVEAVVTRVAEAGGEAFVSRGVTRTIVGLVGDVERFTSLNLRGMAGVSDVVRISAPYKLVSRQHHP